MLIQIYLGTGTRYGRERRIYWFPTEKRERPIARAHNGHCVRDSASFRVSLVSKSEILLKKMRFFSYIIYGGQFRNTWFVVICMYLMFNGGFFMDMCGSFEAIWPYVNMKYFCCIVTHSIEDILQIKIIVLN